MSSRSSGKRRRAEKVYNAAVERGTVFQRQFSTYSESIKYLSEVLQAYVNPGQPYEELATPLEQAAGRYFESALALSRLIAEVGRDEDGTRALVGMIGVDMMVVRQSALLAWLIGERDQRDGQDAVTPHLGEPELADLQPGLLEETTLLLAEIEGTAPPPVAGASSSAPDNTVSKSVRRILDRAGDDIEGVLKVGAAATLSAIAGQALQLWNNMPQGADQLFGLRRLRSVAAKAVEAAREKLGLLWQSSPDWIPQIVTEFGKDVRKALTKGGVTVALGRLLDRDSIIKDSDGKLALPGITQAQVDSTLRGVGRVDESHEHWRGWMPRATLGGRALLILPWPGKRPFVIMAAFVMVSLSVWLAAAYTGSPKLPVSLKLGIRGVSDVVDNTLGLPDAVERAKAKARPAKKR
jgi:hypothetical protein